MPIQSTDIDNTNADGFDFTYNDETYVIDDGVSVVSETGSHNGVATGGYSNAVVSNYGYVSAGDAGIYLTDIYSTLNNFASGSIDGFYYGVYTNAGSDVINNSGTMQSTGIAIDNEAAGASINNSGDIYGGYAIEFVGDGESILNSGLIAGTEGANGIGIDAEFTGTRQSATIRNTGSIVGNSASISSAGAGALVLTNKGTIDGAMTLANTGGDTIYNQSGGEIDGHVKLGNGNNTFDGRGGSIEHGYIQGGTKIDTIHLGNDGEIVNAGAGHDTLYAGNGNDTFAFTSYAAADSDTIFGFNVTHDVVQLNHAQFTKLTAGATPTFSVASAATSATDYLFYNASSGNLFYDPDGSGTGHANLIAKLDAGLKMTAHDFKVI